MLADATLSADARAAVPSNLVQLTETAKGRARPAFERLLALWNLLSHPEQDRPGAAIRLVVERHYAEYATRTYDNADVRTEDLQHLASFADRYPDAREFLSELALLAGLTAENIVSGEESDDKLVLSTIHQAKGLEWPVVFTLWLAEGRFPTAQSLKRAHELEEERRLFYVAITRSMRSLTITHCFSRKKFGQLIPCHPSSFLRELPEDLCENMSEGGEPVSEADGKEMFAAMRELLE